MAGRKELKARKVMEWVLCVQIDGEWEHCRFSDRAQALSAFRALSCDYGRELQRAVLAKTALAPRLNSLASSLIQ
jgi:hypothetical protein